MIPELGQFALALALCLALAQSVAVWRFPWMARPAALAQMLCVTIAFLCLILALLLNDFSVAYVVRHVNTRLPPLYRIAAAWGGHEGSLLFWIFAFCLWTVAFCLFPAPFSSEAAARIAGILGALSFGLLLILVFAFDPFERVAFGVTEGHSLNPLLQDPGLIFHPPMLYMGYAGLALPFAFAVEALIANAPDVTWARGTRFWTIAAWVPLTLGIALGSFWAYYELGWGGWWFWDPVENASLMPWLASTALIHTLPVAEKRGAARAWSLFLGIAAFSLSLIGAFLVRSGLLISVHSFSDAPQRGLALLVFLSLATGVSLALFAWRAPSLSAGGRFGFLSRETALLAGSVLLAVACATVLLGTFYPLLIDALGYGKLSVGPPYFEAVFAPLMIPALFLMGAALLMRWKDTSLKNLRAVSRLNALGALTFGLLLPVFWGAWKFFPALGLTLAAWIALSALFPAAAFPRGRNLVPSFSLRRPAAGSGMRIAHLGVAVFVAGIALAKGYPEEKIFRMAPGETQKLAGTDPYALRLNAVRPRNGPNYHALVVDMDLLPPHRQAPRKLFPEKRFYPESGRTMTETALDFKASLHLVPGEPVDRAAPEGAWSFRVSIQPFVHGIWIGCALMALGGLGALWEGGKRAFYFASGDGAPSTCPDEGLSEHCD